MTIGTRNNKLTQHGLLLVENKHEINYICASIFSINSKLPTPLKVSEVISNILPHVVARHEAGQK